MRKQEFLDGLRAALSTRVGAGIVSENVSYYEDYINTQIRMGKGEEEVIASLGDPRLLARSIAEANRQAGTSGTNGEYESDYRNSGFQNDNYQQNRQYKSNHGMFKTKKFRMPVWLIIFAVIFGILIVCSLLFSVLSFLAPIIVPVLLIVFLVRMIRRT